ncbi:MAG: response regulator [Deltaproteobacteria bacterium]|nr:response regulator [Deltaproteobacteria bacterium]
MTPTPPPPPAHDAGAPASPEEEVPLAVLALLDRFSLFVGLPTMTGLASLQLFAGGSLRAASAYALLAAVMLYLGLGRSRLRRGTRTWTYVGMMLGVSVVGAVAAGPVLSVGAMMTGFITAVALLLRWKQVAIAVTLLEAILIAQLVRSVGTPDWAIWLRATLASPAILIPQGALVLLMRTRLEAAGEEARAALERERLAHDAQLRLSAELDRAQRIESLGRLAGGVAHDVNNALAVVLGNGELLRSSLPLDGEAAEMADDVLRAATSASVVIRQLMLFGQPEGRSGVCQPSSVVHHLVRALRRLLPETISVQVDLLSKGRIAMERAQLERILLNLSLNARDAMADGGSLTLSVCDAEDGLRIRVRDTGSGMSPEVAAKAFEPFFTTKQRGLGTGLGLATVQRQISEAGGKISVQSEAGEGTTFTLTMPLYLGNTDGTPAQATLPAPQGLRVLLAEDDAAVRSSMARMLSRMGHQVHATAEEQEAREALEARQDFQLLITDAIMPRSDTEALIRTFQTLCPTSPVILCSGWIQSPSLQRLVDRGEVLFLPKPFTFGSLTDALRDAAQHPRT